MKKTAKNAISHPPARLSVSPIHSDYRNALWKYYRKNCEGTSSRHEIDVFALRLAERIRSSITQQTKTVGYDSVHKMPKVIHFTCLKAYAEALIADSFSFIRHLSILKDIHPISPKGSGLDKLFFDNIEIKCYNEKSSLSPAAGVISFELSSRINSDTLDEACLTSALLITYALRCSPDVHHINSSLDVLEHFYVNNEHPLSSNP